MPFSIRLLLPIRPQSQRPINEPSCDEADQLIDDDENSPYFLVDACQRLSKEGVRFELVGLFAEPLPITAETDLVYFLEQLPGLLEFIEQSSILEYVLNFWGQGIETQFTLRKRESGKLIDVGAVSSIDRVMTNTTDSISRDQFVAEIVIFVETYNAALQQFLPHLTSNPWNQNLLTLTSRLKSLK